MLTVGLPAASSTNQVADITEEPNPLELSKEALARRPSFRYSICNCTCTKLLIYN